MSAPERDDAQMALAAALVRLRQYGEQTATYTDAAEKALHQIALTLAAEVSSLSDEVTGARLSLWEDGQENLRLRLALASAKRGRSDVRAELYGEQAQHRTTLEQRNKHARELIQMRARVAELETQRAAVLALHRKHTDSNHCFADDEAWPCQTRTALGLVAAPSRDLRPGAEAARRMIRDRHETETASPWERAVAGLNALVDADIAFWIEPDGHISGPFGDEHIEWDQKAARWRLTRDDEDDVHPPHPAPCRVPKSPNCTCPVTSEQARRIERDRPETATSHDCTIPLTRRLDCGHCPHEVCQDCDRCPHTCRCASLGATS